MLSPTPIKSPRQVNHVNPGNSCSRNWCAERVSGLTTPYSTQMTNVIALQMPNAQETTFTFNISLIPAYADSSFDRSPVAATHSMGLNASSILSIRSGSLQIPVSIIGKSGDECYQVVH